MEAVSGPTRVLILINVQVCAAPASVYLGFSAAAVFPPRRRRPPPRRWHCMACVHWRAFGWGADGVAGARVSHLRVSSPPLSAPKPGRCAVSRRCSRRLSDVHLCGLSSGTFFPAAPLLCRGPRPSSGASTKSGVSWVCVGAAGASSASCCCTAVAHPLPLAHSLTCYVLLRFADGSAASMRWL